MKALRFILLIGLAAATAACTDNGSDEAAGALIASPPSRMDGFQGFAPSGGQDVVFRKAH